MIHSVKRAFSIADDHEAEEELRRLAIETGIFSEERPAETVRFLHLTLCEFLAAVEIRESGPGALKTLERILLGDAQDNQAIGRLAEVLVFAASLVGRAERAALMNEILAADKPPVNLVLRIAYENHEHPKEFLEHVGDVVIDAFGSDSQGALDSFRLLAHCTVDEANGTSSENVFKHQLATLVRRAVSEGAVPYETIFETYLRADPDAAITMARERQLEDLLAPANLVRALDDPDVFEFALRSFSVDPRIWGPALAEAALQYRLVAEMLLAHRQHRISESAATGQPRWADIPILSGSMYGAVLDYAESESPQNYNELPKLKLLLHYGAEVVLGSKDENLLRLIFNLAERYSPSTGGSPVQFIASRYSGKIEVWGDPSILEIGPVEIYYDLLTLPNVTLHIFEGLDVDANILGFLISEATPLVLLPNVSVKKSGSGLRIRRSLLRAGHYGHVREVLVH
jgi:hypothetical protein